MFCILCSIIILHLKPNATSPCMIQGTYMYCIQEERTISKSRLQFRTNPSKYGSRLPLSVITFFFFFNKCSIFMEFKIMENFRYVSDSRSFYRNPTKIIDDHLYYQSKRQKTWLNEHLPLVKEINLVWLGISNMFHSFVYS